MDPRKFGEAFAPTSDMIMSNRATDAPSSCLGCVSQARIASVLLALSSSSRHCSFDCCHGAHYLTLLATERYATNDYSRKRIQIHAEQIREEVAAYRMLNPGQYS